MDIEVWGGYILTAAVFFGLGHLVAKHPTWVPAIRQKVSTWIASVKAKRSVPDPVRPDPVPFTVPADPEHPVPFSVPADPEPPLQRLPDPPPAVRVPVSPEVIPATLKTRPAWVKEQ